MSSNIKDLQKVWKCLIDQYEEEQLLYASKVWRKGYEGASIREMPFLEDLRVPRWVIMAMSPGPEDNFYRRMRAMSEGVILVPTYLRPLEEISSYPEEDMYTVVAGLLPLLHDTTFTWALRTFASLYVGSPAKFWPQLRSLYTKLFERGLFRDHRSQGSEFVGPYGYKVLTNFQELHRILADDSEESPIDSFSDLRNAVITSFHQITQ